VTAIELPAAGGTFERIELRDPVEWTRPREPLRSRVAYAATHVVADPLADNSPGAPARLDWDSTLAIREYLWSWGLGVAEAMDTAQRGMGLTWDTTAELIQRSSALAATHGATICAGVGTDHLAAPVSTLDGIVAAYEFQLEVVEPTGATVVLMASRQLAAVARRAEDYQKVYAQLLDQVSRPVILHWLGPMFDPALQGYWGADDSAEASETFLAVIADHAAVIDGVKVSLLDADHERVLRARLPPGVRCYTGDDFNYPDLIAGDGQFHSDALLGAFAVIAPAASAALQQLDAADGDGFRRILDPTVELSRHVFEAPTRNYKTGVAFASWLAGRQPGFTMVGGLQSARSVRHLVRLFRLLDGVGLLPDPDLAARRMRSFLATNGIEP
jgi:hypothetical protein